MSFPDNLQPLDAFIERNFAYRDGRVPSRRTIQNLKRSLPIVRFGNIEFVDTVVFAERCRQQLEPEPPRKRGRPRVA